MPQPSAHRVYLQQSTKEEVKVLHSRHHICLWKSRRNHGTHATVLPTRTLLMVQKDTACTRLDCCRHLHKLCLHNPCPQKWGPNSVFRSIRQSLPAAWQALILAKAENVESNPGPTTHTCTPSLTPVIWTN